ncbi:hypothetical protein DBR42_25260 [Pelomonas sp. HMWF004]|nr:hypothetical protein DBR42_25260 [Pelomonas sp. HMWF004]
MTIRFTFLIAATLALAAGNVRAAEIVLEQTAVQKLIEQSLFNDSGRYYVHRGACAAYFEYPAVSLKDGAVLATIACSIVLHGMSATPLMAMYRRSRRPGPGALP